MARQIIGSVGTRGKNAPTDVTTVQTLINLAGGKIGGPPRPIVVDGVVGPETVGAIVRFQSQNFGWSDGRVDPSGKTLARLNDVADGKWGLSSAPVSRPSPPASAGPAASFAPAVESSGKVGLAWAMITSVSGKVKMRFSGGSWLQAFPGFFLPPGGALMTYDATGAPLTLPLTPEEFNSPYPWRPGSATLLLSDGSKASLGPYSLFVVR